MKRFIQLLLVTTFIAGCKQGTKDKKTDQSSVTPIILNEGSLAGNWIAIKTGVSGTNKKYNSLLRTIADPLKDKIELGILSFQPDSKLKIDEGKRAFIYGKWTVFDNKLTIIDTSWGTGDKPIEFTVTRFIRDTMKIENIMDKKDDTLRFSIHLQRLHQPDSIPGIFDPAMNSWRDRPSKPESNAGIRARLKKILAYYSAYFDMFRKNKIPIFNREKILCPLAFYSGGLGLAPFEESDGWKEVFYDTDAQKAYNMLEKLFASFNDYPDEGKNYVLEYVIALDRMSKKL